MSRHRKSRVPLLVGVTLALVRSIAVLGDEAVAGTLPKDACALLTPAEVQAALAPAVSIGSGISAGSMLPLGVGCTYTWGPRTKEWGDSALTITVIDISTAYPGTRPDTIKEGLLAKAKVGGPDASEIGGVGDAGAFTFEARVSSATVEAYYKGKDLDLSLTFHGAESLHAKEKLVDLLKKAGARL